MHDSEWEGEREGEREREGGGGGGEIERETPHQQSENIPPYHPYS